MDVPPLPVRADFPTSSGLNAGDRPADQGLYAAANEHDSCGVGFVAHIKGKKSHKIIEQGLQILCNLDHRGAVGADPLVGDGAGILIQIPDGLLRDWASKEGVDLPEPGHYAVAMCFLPQDALAHSNNLLDVGAQTQSTRTQTWFPREPASMPLTEMTMVAGQYDYSLTLLLMPDAEWQRPQHDDGEPEEDTFDRFIRNGQHPVR